MEAGARLSIGLDGFGRGEMKKYDHVVSFVCNEPWAVLPDTLDAITDIVRLRLLGMSFSAEEIQARIGSPKRKEPTGGQIAILPVFGVISHRASMFSDISGGTSTERLTQDFRAMLNDSAVDAIVLDVDSPGGRTAGLQEFHAEIMAARGQKKVVAVANSLMASAAYWIASAADEIVAIPSSFTGSVGVVTIHISQAKALEQAGVDVSIIHAGKYKTEGNPYEPLDDEARTRLQEMADRMYGRFVGDVAEGRGVSLATVREKYGQGRVLDSREALEAGLVDRVATMDETLARLATKRGRVFKSMVASADTVGSSATSGTIHIELDADTAASTVTEPGTPDEPTKVPTDGIEPQTQEPAKEEPKPTDNATPSVAKEAEPEPAPKTYPRNRAKAQWEHKARFYPRVR